MPRVVSLIEKTTLRLDDPGMVLILKIRKVAINSHFHGGVSSALFYSMLPLITRY